MSESKPSAAEFTQQCLERCQELDRELAAISEDDPSRWVKMNTLAGAIGDYHSKANIRDEGRMIAALEMSATAEAQSPPGDFLRGSAMFTQMMLCFTLWDLTGLIDWMQKGVEFGCESVAYLKQNPNVAPSVYRRLLANRNEAVAVGYLKLFEHSAEQSAFENLELCVAHQGPAVDFTVPSELGDEGIRKRFDRFMTYCEVVTRWQAYRSIEEQENTWDHLIGLVLSLHFYEEDDQLHRAMLWNLCALLTRRWVLTQREDHMDALLQKTVEEMRAGRTTARVWSENADIRQHVVRVAANRFLAEIDDTPIWRDHLQSIDAAIAIWEEVRKGISKDTVGDLRESLDPLIRVRDLYERRYKITKKPVDGWTSERLIILSTHISNVVHMNESSNKDDEDLDSNSWVMPGAISCVIGTSIVTGSMFTLFRTSGHELDDCRLMFSRGNSVDEDWVPTIDNWIREWRDDGTYALGGAKKGQDDDVFEYVMDYNKKLERKG